MSNPAMIWRLWLAIGYGLVAAVVFLSLTPAPPVEMGGGRDKIYHALAYGTLMLWFVQGYPRGRWPLIAAACAALGIALEYLQGWSGIRTFGYDDMLGDVVGVAIGWMLAVGGANEGVARVSARLNSTGD